MRAGLSPQAGRDEKYSSFRGASKASEPGIHNHDRGLWIPGLRQEAHPGMTVERDAMLSQTYTLNSFA
jgi:hypothetical protein